MLAISDSALNSTAHSQVVSSLVGHLVIRDMFTPMPIPASGVVPSRKHLKSDTKTIPIVRYRKKMVPLY